MEDNVELKRQSIKEHLETSKDVKIKRGYEKYQQQKEKIKEFVIKKKEWR